MGVAEHTFDVNLHGKSVTWHLFDVGGARGQRHTWVPYFDDANAIIFVAPVSAFDQVRTSHALATLVPVSDCNTSVSGRGSQDQQDRRFVAIVHSNMLQRLVEERPLGAVPE